jgi:hypothetical protein
MLCAYLASGCSQALRSTPPSDTGGRTRPVALGIAALAIHEGRKAWNGEGCCPPTAIQGEIATRLEQDFCH